MKKLQESSVCLSFVRILSDALMQAVEKVSENLSEHKYRKSLEK